MHVYMEVKGEEDLTHLLIFILYPIPVRDKAIKQ